MKLTPEMKAALLKRHGGHDGDTDDQLLTLWNSLPESAQEQYLAIPKPAAAPPTAKRKE